MTEEYWINLYLKKKQKKKLWVCYFPIGILVQVWYLIVSIPDRCHLSYFVLASHRYCSTHCVNVVDIWEKKKSWIAKTTTSKCCVSRRCQTCAVSFEKPHLSLILTNQSLAIMVTVINIVPLWWHCPCADPEGDRGSGHPPPPGK